MIYINYCRYFRRILKQKIQTSCNRHATTASTTTTTRVSLPSNSEALRPSASLGRLEEPERQWTTTVRSMQAHYFRGLECHEEGKWELARASYALALELEKESNPRTKWIRYVCFSDEFVEWNANTASSISWPRSSRRYGVCVTLYKCWRHALEPGEIRRSAPCLGDSWEIGTPSC